MVKKPVRYFSLKRSMTTLIFLLICHGYSMQCQTPEFNFYYRVSFADKGPVDINSFSPYDLLSERAVDRREKAGIPVPDFNDIPVYQGYINEISALGFKLHCVSKWMNSALFKTENMQDINTIMGLPFVKSVKIVRDQGAKNLLSDKLGFITNRDYMPPWDNPVSMVNGKVVHQSGFNGKGILIAVLDGGFDNADNISSLADLRKRNGIKGTYNFVTNNQFVYGYHTHGTAVLSILAGNIPGSIEGTAQGADYLLLRSEDTNSEFPVEEDYWIAAAEFADSTGADIISSSLGYYAFDDPLYDYKFSDMDGNSAFVTQAADIAASRGILVVNSAGNERDDEWIHIIAPSDGDSVLAIGAVDWNGTISSFSSAGPSFDKRVKPDLVAQGVNVPVQVSNPDVVRSSGTSFSCPVISGMSACVMQAVPQATALDIAETLRSVSDQHNNPDSLYGNGIPDFAAVISKLQEKYISAIDNGSVVGPNPFSNELRIEFKEIPGSLDVEIYDTGGRILYKKQYGDYISRILVLDDLHNLRNGIYILRLRTPAKTFIHRLIRINR
jgi:hypothetical protein